MELTHDFTVPAPIDVAWQTFMDLEGVGQCFPGATVTEVTEEGFSGTVKVKLGPIALVYAGAGQFLTRDDAAYRAVIEAKGKDKRGNGTAGATVTIQLAPSGEGTRIDVVTDLSVTGKPAQFGRGVMQDVSDKLLGQFVGCIEGRFAGMAASPGAAAPEPGPTEARPDGTGAEPGTPQTGAAEPGAGPSGEQNVAAPSPATTPVSAPFAPPNPAVRADDSIDLGRTVLPVLVKEYAGRTVIAALALVVGYLLGRRRH